MRPSSPPPIPASPRGGVYRLLEFGVPDVGAAIISDMPLEDALVLFGKQEEGRGRPHFSPRRCASHLADVIRLLSAFTPQTYACLSGQRATDYVAALRDRGRSVVVMVAAPARTYLSDDLFLHDSSPGDDAGRGADR